jgi:hypothetical protein
MGKEKTLEELIELQQKRIKALGRRLDKWQAYLRKEQVRLDSYERVDYRSKPKYSHLTYLEGRAADE